MRNDDFLRAAARWGALPALALTALAGSGHARPAQGTDPLIGEALVPALEELAAWCHGRKLYGMRSEVYESILRWSPDHSSARRSLKHTKRKGEWAPPARPYRPKNKNDEALEEFPRVRADLLAPYCRAVVAQLDERGLSPFEREGHDLLRRALEASPDDPGIRGLLGEVRLGQRWVLEETALGAVRRNHLRFQWERSLAEAREHIVEGAPGSLESVIDVSWSATAQGPYLRVFGTGSAAEVFRAAEVGHAAEDFLSAVLRRRTRRAEGSVVFLLAGDGERADFLDSYPGLTDDERDFYAQLAGGEMPGDGRIAQWGSYEDHRLDGVTRHLVDAFLRRSFWLDSDDGWIGEGLGGYLTWRMTGTRLTWRVQSSAGLEESDYIDRRTLFGTPAEHWFEMCVELVEEDDLELDLEGLLGRHIDDMNTADLLASFVLSAYLVEGRTELVEILGRIGRGQPSGEAVAESLDQDFHELEWRLLTWLRQLESAPDITQADLAASPVEPGTAAAAVVLSATEERALLDRLERMEEDQRTAVIQRCADAARKSGAPQVELVRSWIESPAAKRVETPLEPLAPGGSGLLIGPGDLRWENLQARLPLSLASSVALDGAGYDFATGRVFGASTDVPTVEDVRHLLQGILPGQSLAAALLLREIDAAGKMRDEAEFFSRPYSDIAGNAYSETTLFELWSNETEMEVPDADVRAFAKEVWEENLPARLGDATRDVWYERMARAARELRRCERTAGALAAAWFEGTPDVSPEIGRQLEVLHALIVDADGDAEVLAERFGREGAKVFHAARKELDSIGPAIWARAEERRIELDRGLDAIRAAVLVVLVEEGLIEG